MTFGEFMAVVIAVGMIWAVGALFGVLCGGFLGRFTMLVSAIMHVTLFVVFMCYGCGYGGVMDLLEEIFGMDVLEGLMAISLPAWGICGSYFGKKFKIRIERR